MNQASEFIKVRGARQHNLKNVNLDIPKNKLVVFTGLSGSGKSSLAFDTIYAEGQRRYVESLSSYARQFLGIMNKPDVDQIEGLSPAISIDQKTTSHNPRSTVGTVTEIYDYLRLLFARVGHPHCPICDREITQQSAQQITAQIMESIKDQLQIKPAARYLILAPLIKARKGTFHDLFENLRKQGFIRVRVDNQIIKLDQDILLLKNNQHTIEVVTDRVSVDKKIAKDEIAWANLKSKITAAVEQALKIADGQAIISEIQDAGFEIPEKPKQMIDHLYSEKFSCPVDNLSLPPIEPRSFSFNSPQGACPECVGLGIVLKIDPESIIKPNLTLTEGGILPFANMFDHDTWYSRLVTTACEENHIDIRKPLGQLTEDQIQLLFHGTGHKTYRVSGENKQGKLTSITEKFIGIIPELERRYQSTESEWIRNEIEKYMRKETCPACLGARLKPESLSVTIDQHHIASVTSWPIDQTLEWITGLLPYTEENHKATPPFTKGDLGRINNSTLSNFDEKLETKNPVLSPTEGLKLTQREQTIAQPILREIKARIGFLVSVGLEYLTLDRAAASLAGGEAQRIRLASQIGSGLSGVLYVLDEPSIGLHPRDNQRLTNSLTFLRDLGNTVIVVEHDEDIMLASDWIIDFGPGAGKHGGAVTAEGTPKDIRTNPNSLTGKYLSGKKKIETRNLKLKTQDLKLACPVPNGIGETRNLKLVGASQHNLKSVTADFPLSHFITITGVSGSGKSTLIVETLYHALAQKLIPAHKQKPGDFQELQGHNHIDKVILVDQSPIGRTPRSNPATYTSVFTPIRELFAQAPEARVRGYKPGRFSFNVKGGRCETCEGGGQTKIEMQFLSDLYVTCDVCNGKRYNDETLEVEYKNKNIYQVLEMTVDEAYEFFHNHPQIKPKLETLRQVGLGYIELGQSAPTLSGGEAQRVKLATELSKRQTGRTVYILDEPTTGLHFADLEKLISVLRALVDKGNTVIVIEHNLDVIRASDWIIDLGPEGGERGGQIIFTGPPQKLAEFKDSYTGQWLTKSSKHEIIKT
jgi:excinuclease ABC subunit A